ncbi:UNVERIFIED_CONTAM: hypothetical protein GTU68_065682 [Idotea baltica]|nr:hypothetical protein [Idotea baltica]
MSDLESLIGLGTIKEKVKDYTQYLSFLKLRQEKGFEDPQKINLHAVFTGNPGTGKTTVAKMLGKLYHKMGLLEKGHVHEVDRSDLVGEFIGQTAPKVKEAIKKASGGVLFIDEAYALTQGTGADYGREAVETILKRMEDQRGEFIVIAAGYPDNMKRFMESNPGLKSRFDKHFNFEDYKSGQLFEIAQLMLTGEDLTPDEAAEEHLRKYFKYCCEHKDKFFGNARTVRKIIEEAVKHHDLRLAGMDPEARTPEMLKVLAFEDVEEFHPDRDKLVGSGQNRIGFSVSREED